MRPVRDDPQRDLLLQYPDAADPDLPARTDAERHRGYAGTLIALHRGMATEPRTPAKSLSSAGLVVGVLALWVLAFDWVTLAWTAILGFWQDVFGMGGYALRLQYEWGLKFPYLGFPSALPTPGLWTFGAIIAAGLFIGSLFVPRRLLPMASGLRVVAFFQAGAQVFFAFWPEAFPYGGAGYVHGMLIAGLMFITIVPVILGITYYVLDVGWQRKLGLTLVIMLHQVVFVPLQFMAHALAIYQFSVLFLPLLFFVFGLPVNVLAFISLYGWGASWRSRWSHEPVPVGRLATVARGGGDP